MKFWSRNSENTDNGDISIPERSEGTLTIRAAGGKYDVKLPKAPVSSQISLKSSIFGAMGQEILFSEL